MCKENTTTATHAVNEKHTTSCHCSKAPDAHVYTHTHSQSGIACCCCHNDKHHHDSEGHHHHHHDLNYRQWVTIALSSIGLIWGIFTNPLPAYPWLIFVLAYIPVGIPIFKEALGEIRHGDIFNEFTLMIIATLGAFAIGEYPEAIAVLLLYSLGEYFQSLAVGRAQRDIQALISLRPDHATVIDGQGQRTTCRPEEVTTGQIIEVKAGERVPLDCRLLTEQADFDASALTGESVPRSLHQNDEVLAGLIVTRNPVQMTVIRPYAESALQRILVMVQDAARHKSHSERFIRRFARIYTPVVTIAAGLIALIPPLVGLGDWNSWIYRALVFLVISCPCALVISIPLCYFRGIGIASRYGILFKGGNYLDAITRIHHVVFDKTGTLTSGKFGIVNITPDNGFSTTDVLRYTAALERFSTHPLAQAIAAQGNISETCETSHVEEFSGKGIKGKANGHDIVIGQADFLHSQGIALDDSEDKESPYTYIFCAIDNLYAGKIALRDQARPDAQEAIARLHQLGIHQTSILSGDRHAVVRSLAAELGVCQFYGELLPEDKVNICRQIKSENQPGELTAFVGDGINDAPVLALSDIGIAMGQGGSDAAVETADVVIHNSQPSCVADAVSIGRSTRQIVYQNIVIAIGLKVSILLLSILGLTGLWAAVLADTGVALLCVANTYRIRK